VYPACILVFAAHILEVEVGSSDVLGDALNMDYMAIANSEVLRTTGTWTSVDAAGPSTEDATQAVWAE
jgi:hypothetical protein